MSVAFWYKTLAFGVFGWILYQQKGTSGLSRNGRDFFWSLFCMAVLLALVFTFGAIDRFVHPETAITTNVGEARNVLRNLLIATVVGVVIYGSRFMDAVFEYIREQYQEALRKAAANVV